MVYIRILNASILKRCFLFFCKVMVRKWSDICWFNVCGWPGCVKTLKPSWWVNSQSCGSKSSVIHQRLGSQRCSRWFQSSNCHDSWMFGMLGSCQLTTFVPIQGLNQVWAATSMSEVLLEMQTAQWPHSYYSYRFKFFYVLSSCCQIKSPFFVGCPTLMPNFEIRKIYQSRRFFKDSPEV